MAKFISWAWTVRNILDSGVTRESLCEYAQMEPESLKLIEKGRATPADMVAHRLQSLSDRITRAKFKGKIKPRLVHTRPQPVAPSGTIEDGPERGVFEVKPLAEGWRGWNMIDAGELLVEIRVHSRAMNRNVPRGLQKWLEELAPTLKVMHGGLSSSSSDQSLPASEEV